MAQRGLSVTDRSNDTPTYEGAMQFTDNADEDVEYEYDQNGNMTNVSIKRGQSKRVCSGEREKGRAKPKDLNANITSIQYNCLNLPSTITAFQYHTYPLPRPHTTRRDYNMHYTYNADGEKIMVSEDPVVSLGLNAAGAATATTSGGAARATGGVLPGIPEDSLVTGSVIVNPEFDLSTRYCGNVIFEKAKLKRLLTDEGYVTFASNGTPTYHYYLRDHLGNVRVVFNQTGTVEQRNDYYPSGAIMATSTGGSVQPYKYNFSIERGKSKLAYSSEREKNRPKVNGKELERMNGLDLYDYGARWMDAALGRFTTIDPMCEKYYSVSPYAYCAGNPVNLLDPDGRVVIIHYLNQDGKYVYQKYFGKMTSHNNQFFQDVIDTYHYFKETGGGENFIEAVESRDIEIHIHDANLFGTSTKSSPYDGDACVFWQSRKGLLLTNDGKQSPATRLEHEFDHVMDQEKNPNEHAERQKGKDKDYDNKEERRVILGSERDTAKKHGEGIRYDHRGKPYETKGPTTTEEER